jgi:hypothetical protein
MQSDTPHQKNIRQVQLPSGKVIEVVYFADRRVPPASAARTTAARTTASRDGDSDRDLHVCPDCSSGLVYPVDWSEAGSSHWQVVLRCPDCEWSETGVFAQTVVERFDAELDRGSDALLRDLQQLVRANMAEEIERFIHALQNDHVVPADF